MMDASGAGVEAKSTVIDVEPKPEETEDANDEASYYICGLCDKELTDRISHHLLSGLATACVDNTTGDPFKKPISVAAEIRKEMVDYLIVRSQSFSAESVVLDTLPGAEASEHPSDILATMMNDFLALKRSLWSRVSGWMLSEVREERIEKTVQQMEREGFWPMDIREPISDILIKNVDFEKLYHCVVEFRSEEEVLEHQKSCDFRTVVCENEGCNDAFSADTLETHDSICPFKILPCEQKCSEYILRRDMDQHCITVCPKKLGNCPFSLIGCKSPVQESAIKKHCADSTHAHLLNALQFIHKEASIEDVELWAKQIEKSKLSDQLQARDVRAFTNIVKDIEKKIGPFVATKQKEETSKDTPAPQSKQGTIAPVKQATTTPTKQAATALKDQSVTPPLLPQPQDVASPPTAAKPEQAATTVKEATTVPPPTTKPPEQVASKLDTVTPPEPQQAVTAPSTQQAVTAPPTQQAVTTPPTQQAVTAPPTQQAVTGGAPQGKETASPSPNQAVPAPLPEQAKSGSPDKS